MPGEPGPGRTLLRVSLPWACFGLDVRDGVIVGPSAPIARWCIGKPVPWVARYWTGRGATLTWIFDPAPSMRPSHWLELP